MTHRDTSLTYLLEETTKSLNVFVDRVVKEHREQKEFLVKIIEIDNNLNDSLITKEHVIERVHALAEDAKEILAE